MHFDVGLTFMNMSVNCKSIGSTIDDLNCSYFSILGGYDCGNEIKIGSIRSDINFVMGKKCI